MLDFKNGREVTEEMMQRSREYTEKFWQSVFDYCLYKKFDGFSMAYGGMCFEPNDAWGEDPYDVFFLLRFEVYHTCYGEIGVKFEETDDKSAEVAFRLSVDCLLNNHFTRVDEKTFVLQNVMETN